ncbi:MAG: YceI family protein [Pseudomonadota bacterium]
MQYANSIGIGKWSRISFAALSCAAVTACASVQTDQTSPPSNTSANWAVDYGASDIRFAGTYSGQAFNGTFDNWRADITWYPEALDASSVSVEVDTGRIAIEDKSHGETLKAPEWFNIGAFPSATVNLDNFEERNGKLEGEAKVTVKNTSAVVPFTFNIIYDGDRATMTGATTLERSRLGLGQESDPAGDWVSNEISVTVRVEAVRSR